MVNFDPQVRSMRTVDIEGLPCSSLISFAFRAELKGGSVVVVLVEDGVPATAEDFEPLGCHIVLRRAQVTKEPMASALRTVWSNKDQRIPPGKRLKMLAAIGAWPDSIRLDALVEMFPTGEDEGVADILRLVCDNELTVDLTRGIVSEAIVRRVSLTGV